MKIFITGGAGFIGSNFIRHVLSLNKGYKIVNYDKLTYAGNLANLESVADHPDYSFVRGGICDANAVEEAMRGCDTVVHFAAESHVDRSIYEPAPVIDTNVTGTFFMLQVSRKLNIERFVHISTDEVYGDMAPGAFANENSLLQPSSPYSASKASSDLLARAYYRTHGLPVCITRCSNNYGPHQFPEKVIPLFLTNLMDGHKVPLYGDGLNVRDWLHVDDHCAGIAMVAERGRPGEIYNIGGGTEMSNKELTGLLLEATGNDWSMVEPVTDRKGHDRRYSVDHTKISEELGYQPQVSFADGLARTVAW